MMKKVRMIICLILTCILMINIDVFASTRVNIRTDEDYLVPSGITVTESNKWNVLNTPAVDASEKVYDFAELLTAEEEEKLYKQIKKFIDGSSLDLAIVTIEENVKNSAKTYAHDFYDYNFFDYDGLLFLIDMDTRTIYMTTSGGAVSLFPDSRMQLILENVYNKVSNKNYYQACSTFVNSIGSFVNLGESTGDEDVIINDDGTVKKDLHLFEVFLFALIGTLVIIVIMIFSQRTVKMATSSRNFLNKDSMKIVHISETFLGTHTSRTPISDNSSGRSGGGGVSISRGSSGRSHGGAGRKF